ncbi:hypothetical protein [Streptomyces pseudovenezuelae]|uniref:Uncharacterized protein n=1 Tax=Streptomyces pseudovenezuelae TaxID=67350 RepID=A0ABT6M2Q4_9ACTN|nr:hypothetical protein [Streptomyces pseudovenezuelae]MDH6222831.1 hypothetical protein [Streptomyces pseudovenezuelae]
MDDSRQPERIIERGPWALWDEYESNGTVPQQDGFRLCSLHAKGEVGDALIAQEIGDRPFRQVTGFNADEAGRSRRDQAASKNPLRQGVYPLDRLGVGAPAVRSVPVRAVRGAVGEELLQLLLYVESSGSSAASGNVRPGETRGMPLCGVQHRRARCKLDEVRPIKAVTDWGLLPRMV